MKIKHFLICVLALAIVEGRTLRIRRSDFVYPKNIELTWHEKLQLKQPKSAGFSQSSAANTVSQTTEDRHGVRQQSAGGSVAANLANDGSSGQVSATNTQQQTSRAGDRYQSQISAQGQSANFGKDHQHMSSANTNTNTVNQGGNIRKSSTGGAGSSVVDKYGTQSNQAQTSNEQYVNRNGQKGSRSRGSSNSINSGPGGSGASNANTGAETIVLPDGTKRTITYSSSSSFQISSR